jgi:hypothetical protein
MPFCLFGLPRGLAGGAVRIWQPGRARREFDAANPPIHARALN